MTVPWKLNGAELASLHLRDPRVIALSAPAYPLGPRRAAIVQTPGGAAVHPEVEVIMATAGKALEAAGYVVEPVEPPEFQRTGELWAARPPAARPREGRSACRSSPPRSATNGAWMRPRSSRRITPCQHRSTRLPRPRQLA